MNPALSKQNKLDDARKGGVKFADLHLHTVFSDGTYTPQELIRKASMQGLSAIAISDHDTVCGIKPSIEAGS